MPRLLHHRVDVRDERFLFVYDAEDFRDLGVRWVLPADCDEEAIKALIKIHQDTVGEQYLVLDSAKYGSLAKEKPLLTDVPGEEMGLWQVLHEAYPSNWIFRILARWSA